jgi:hypothetical protein
MARKEQKIVHPMDAIDALNGYHSDVGFLLSAVASALTFLKDESLDARTACQAVTPALEDGLANVRRWYDAP